MDVKVSFDFASAGNTCCTIYHKELMEVRKVDVEMLY